MSVVRPRGENVRRYILENIEQHAADISKQTSAHFKISRQAVNKYLQKLVFEKALVEIGTTRGKSYKLAPLLEWSQTYHMNVHLEEDVIWTKDVLPLLGKMPDNVSEIWFYGFTEMFNNAIDHSGATEITVYVKKTAVNTEIIIADNGIGIFKKIQAALNLLDESHAIFELSKGKLTTDPARHTGEGIFFSSRVFDDFAIYSGAIVFSHAFGDHHDFLSELPRANEGTAVWMKLNNHTARILLKIFKEYQSNDEEYRFNKTVIPVKLAQYGHENLISRSQAKRVLARIERFQVVILDFSGVNAIGQAFADEIFRVFSNSHPNIELGFVNANQEIKQMIERAKHNIVG
jgi:hypothetical protein